MNAHHCRTGPIYTRVWDGLWSEGCGMHGGACIMERISPISMDPFSTTSFLSSDGSGTCTHHQAIMCSHYQVCVLPLPGACAPIRKRREHACREGSGTRPIML